MKDYDRSYLSWAHKHSKRGILLLEFLGNVCTVSLIVPPGTRAETLSGQGVGTFGSRGVGIPPGC